MAANPIFVETEEEIPAVIERIKSTEASEVPLVLPARSRFGQSRFNFQLLRDYAVRLGKRVAIISADPAVQRMAQESGFAAYRAVDHYTPFPESPEAPTPAAPLAPEPQPRLVEVVPDTAEVAPIAPAPDAPASEVAAAAAPVPPPPVVQPPPKPPIRVVPDDVTPPAPGGARPRIKVAAPKPLPSKLATEVKPSRIVLYVGAGLILLVGLVAMVVYVPSAKVRLVADAKPFSTDAEIAAEPSKPPIKVRTATVTKQASASQKATGVKTIPGTVAKGTVSYSSRCPFILLVPNGQRLTAANGVQFAQQGDSGQLLPGQSVSVPVAAANPGANGNVGAGQISVINNAGPEFGCLTVSNPQPTSGGADEQRKTVVSTADVDAVRSSLDQQLRRQATDDLARQVQGGEKLADPPVVATPEFITDHKVDDETGSFNATMKLTAEGAYYLADDVNRAFADALEKKVPADQQLTGNRPKVDSRVTAATAGGHLTFRGTASGYVAPKIDLARVKAELPGKPTGRARTDLARLPVRSVEIQEYPLKLPIMPLAGSRIDLEYEVSPAPAPKSA